MAKENNFTKELPQDYKEIYSIDAKNAKIGIIMNVVAFVIFLLIFIPLFILCDLSSFYGERFYENVMSCLAFAFLGLIICFILHELVHGFVYKITTGQKLTFGLSWSCAFCGVPNVYVTRKTAIFALLAPFVFFSIIFIIALILFYPNPAVFLSIAFVFALHTGGCAGDLYVFLLFLFKLKDKRILMNDTGPKQTFYIPNK
ncbi:MAG: DUF3267 domain-containing protein [Clostridiales bacterium]|nr:DUF3267 domain-containing protein [Clostridiales bacterium]